MNNPLSRANTLLSHIKKTIGLVWKACPNWTIAWMLLLFIQGVLPAATVYLTRLLVNSLVAVSGAGITWDKIQIVLIPFALMAGVMLLSELLTSLAEWIRTAQSEFIRDYISTLVHKQSMTIDIACYESSDYHDYLNRARSGAGNHSLSLLENTGNLVKNSITLLTMVAVLIPYGLALPIILVCSAIPAFYVVLRLNRRYHRWWHKTTIDRRWLQYYEILLTESAFAAEIRLFGLGSYFQLAYQKLRTRLRGENNKLIREQSLGRFAAGVITLLLSATGIAWMGRQVLLGVLTLGDLALFYQAFEQGQGLVRAALGNLGQIYKNSLYVNDLFHFLELEAKVVDPAQPKPVPEKFSQGIRLRNLTFSYPGSERAVLENFNLNIPAGKIVAIVGDNGAGKSTVIKLLCRFYDPASGSVEIDGINVRDFAVEQLRRNITVLFQNPIPYYTSVSQNIGLGDLLATQSIDKIQVAASAAGIDETIANLPNGYDSMLGKWFPNGNDLSGGQWQRLALARSFFRKAQLIILDEPTSAMDPWAEFDWLERFRKLAENRTAVVITHRFTLAMRADIIHVMRAGKIVESGSHDELLSLNGLYAQSWKTQIESSPTNPTENNLYIPTQS